MAGPGNLSGFMSLGCVIMITVRTVLTTLRQDTHVSWLIKRERDKEANKLRRKALQTILRINFSQIEEGYV